MLRSIIPAVPPTESRSLLIRQSPFKSKNTFELATRLLEIGLSTPILLGMNVQPNSDTSELIARLRAGDASVWTSVIQQMGSDLFVFIKCRNSSKADDLCQTLWLKAWNSRDKLVNDNLRAWLYSIARNLLIDEYRRQKKCHAHTAVEAIDLASESMDEQDPRLDALRDCMSSLDEQCRKLIQRFYIENTSTSDLAMELGIAEGTIGSGTSRCRKKLKACIEKK